MDFSLVYYGAQWLAGLIAFVTIWGWLPLDHWWVRGVDFPRIQIMILGIFAWVGMVAFGSEWQLGQWLLFGLLSIALAFQLRMVLPYTIVWKKEVLNAKDKPDVHEYQLKIMVSNVLTTNDDTQKLVELVQQKQPDILIKIPMKNNFTISFRPVSTSVP